MRYAWLFAVLAVSLLLFGCLGQPLKPAAQNQNQITVQNQTAAIDASILDIGSLDIGNETIPPELVTPDEPPEVT